jgi:hypothetical protein
VARGAVLVIRSRSTDRHGRSAGPPARQRPGRQVGCRGARSEPAPAVRVDTVRVRAGAIRYRRPPPTCGRNCWCSTASRPRGQPHNDRRRDRLDRAVIDMRCRSSGHDDRGWPTTWAPTDVAYLGSVGRMPIAAQPGWWTSRRPRDSRHARRRGSRWTCSTTWRAAG